MTSLRRPRRGLAVALLLIGAARPVTAQSTVPAVGPYAPVGLFFGAIEEGARIFTPVRLLPREHPEALGHEFPTVLQLHGTEFPMLLWLGQRVGFRLWPTLERYPTQPASDWPYAGFRAPPDSAALAGARVERRPATAAPIPGLRAALFDGADVVAFLVDTRGLTLAARHMSRATAMGLEIDRADFLRGLRSAAPATGTGLVAIVWTP